MTVESYHIGEYERTGADGTGVSDQDLWRRFAEAGTTRAFCESWLHLQCRLVVGGVRAGLVLLGMPDRGPFSPAAVWPAADVDVTHLAVPAERALKERRGLLITDDRPDDGTRPLRPGCFIAYPVTVCGKVHGAVVLEAGPLPAPEIQEMMRQLHWGAAWLEVMLLRAETAAAEQANERLRGVLDTVASALEHERFQPAAMAFVTRLATMLSCERVCLGFLDGRRLRIRALSHSADFGERANLMRAIEGAMEEAVDQCALVVYPPPAGAPPLVTREHEALTRQYGAGVVCTVPLGPDDDPFGALTLELPASRTLDDATLDLVGTIASLAGPILNGKRQEDRLLIVKGAEKAAAFFRGLVGPSHAALKLGGVLAVFFVLFVAFADGTYRVKAPTVLEGTIQRTVSAPVAGFIAEAAVRPGDVVRARALLCRLDDRDLRLERLTWMTQREQLWKEHRGALARHEAAQVRIIGAKLDQAHAQISLLDEQLARIRVTAPFDGVVMSGDLSHSLGAPVERGQTLFEIAPLDSYRVIVQVDERDVGDIRVGQKGTLALPSVPGEVLPLTVSAITPVSTAKEGRNYFRVEAGLEKTSHRLRPGMEGVGKIEVDRRKLLWIWTHEMIDWLRLRLWSWLP